MSNISDARNIREYIARIDALNDEIIAERNHSIAVCKHIGQRIKDIYDQATDDGLPKRALRAAYVRLQLRRKIEAERMSLEDFRMQEDLDKIEQALGFETTPLGMAMAGED